MLLQYGVNNFLSFKEGAEISLKLDGNVPALISSGRNYATILCVKGANGSGKTHLLKGLAFMANFASKSFNWEPSGEIPVDSFFESNAPSDFFAEFIIDNTSYCYELSVTKHKVLREALYETKKRKIMLFERNGDKVKTIQRIEKIKSMKLRENASIISTAYQHQIIELSTIYNFFDNIKFNVTKSGFSRNPDFFNLNHVSKFLFEHPEYLNLIKDFICECDIGISDITIASEDGDDGKKKFFPVFHHDVGDKLMKVYHSTESHGTIHLYGLLLSYAFTLQSGGIFIADEFDAFLHPAILPKILDLFTDPEKNQKGAQLIFSAHDSDILDIAGKYRTYLVNKEDNASYAYRLDEIPGDILRNGRSISTPYREGRVGGVPRL